jgi:hypothetical protein
MESTKCRITFFGGRDGFTQDSFEEVMSLPLMKNLEHLSLTHNYEKEEQTTFLQRFKYTDTPINNSKYQTLIKLKSLKIGLSPKNQNLVLSLCPPTLKKLKLKIADAVLCQSSEVDVEIILRFKELENYSSVYFYESQVDIAVLTNNWKTLKKIRIDNSPNFEDFMLGVGTSIQFPVLKKLDICEYTHRDHRWLSNECENALGERHRTWFPRIESLIPSRMSVNHLQTESSLINFLVFVCSLEELYRLLSFPHSKKWKNVTIKISICISWQNLFDVLFHFYDQPGVKWELWNGVSSSQSKLAPTHCDDQSKKHLFKSIDEFKSDLSREVKLVQGHDTEVVSVVQREIEMYVNSELECIVYCCDHNGCKKVSVCCQIAPKQPFSRRNIYRHEKNIYDWFGLLEIISGIKMLYNPLGHA